MIPGCLLIHGFGGDISEIEPLERYLKGQGINVKCSELMGHTGIRRDLNKVEYLDWIASAQDDLDEMGKCCDTLFIIGFSMGGLIAVNLAFNNRVAGIAMLNSPIYCWNKRQIISNIVHDLKNQQNTCISRYLQSTVKFPIKALLQFNLLLKRTKYILGHLKCPLFIGQGLLDDTVSPKSAEYIRKNSGSSHKTIRYYRNSNHLICHGPDSRILFADLMGFISNKGIKA